MDALPFKMILSYVSFLLILTSQLLGTVHISHSTKVMILLLNGPLTNNFQLSTHSQYSLAFFCGFFFISILPKSPRLKEMNKAEKTQQLHENNINLILWQRQHTDSTKVAQWRKNIFKKKFLEHCNDTKEIVFNGNQISIPTSAETQEK